MLLTLLILAETAPQADSTAALIGAVATLLVAFTGLLALLFAQRRKRKPDDDEPVDQFATVREHVQQLERALETANEETDDVKDQLRDCRQERDQQKARADDAHARLSLALVERGGMERQIADLRQRVRELEAA